jgi:hypothetical protein
MSGQIAFAPLDGSTARFSACGTYRYELARRWAHGPVVTWIMLNPSTADASVNDPTIRRCIGFSRAWNFAGLAVVNLFAFRSTDPKALKTVDDPVGPDNHAAIHDAVVRSRLVVAAWGAHEFVNGRAGEVRETIAEIGRPLLCLGKTKAGHPRHPLYVSTAQSLERLDCEEG